MNNICDIIRVQYKITKLPLAEIELILAHVCRKSRVFIISHPDFFLSASQNRRAQNYIRRRIKGEPLAYLFGSKEFYGLNFIVNKNVLIPRPETEMMVEEAAEILKDFNQATIIDLGTGSGCLIISLISNFQFLISNKFPISNFKNNYNFYATDISEKTLSIAKKNAKRHKVKQYIKFYQGNLLDPLINNTKFKIQNSKLTVLANLPYLAPPQIRQSPSIKYEPRLALSAGRDGLKYYRELFKQIQNLYKSVKICSLSVLCEIDPSQTISFKKMVKTCLPSASLQIKKDLRGHNRLAVVTQHTAHNI
ncbi:MAG: peptide chain release factor N(5)-glutamine methyltransferase [Planctomycetes bacterium]|jgi:release factor glutamine methyltransferase|nr:peptide chain release factor N(5)-glutamine methyltransferase [Planctomycetota bacterium]